jgi:ribosomal-protein-alanine N-acetyltransferase
MTDRDEPILREFTRDDIPALISWTDREDEKQLLRWAGPVFHYPLTAEQVQHYLSGLIRDRLYCIEVDGSPVGIIELGDIQQRHRNARIGKVFIGDHRYRGRGIATRALHILLSIAFDQMRLHKVLLSVLSENRRAIKTYTRSGFIEESRLVEHRLSGGQWHDLIQMSILRSRWMSLLKQPREICLSTPRLILQTPLIDDAQRCCDYYRKNRDLLSSFGPKRSSEFYTKSFQEELIIEDAAKLRRNASLRLWIARKEQPEVYIGNMSLSQIVMGNFQSAFLGYQLDIDYLRQGYMTEALTTFITYGFEQIRLHRIEANIMPDNTPSRELAQKLGFVYEGLGQAYLNINGKWTDHMRYTLISTRWKW